MSLSSVEECEPIFHLSQKGPRDQKTSEPTGRHNVIAHAPKDPNCQAHINCPSSVQEPPGCTRTLYSTTAKNGDAFFERRIIKFSMKRTNLVCRIVTHSVHRIFYSFWDSQSYPTKNTTAQDMMKYLHKFMPPD